MLVGYPQAYGQVRKVQEYYRSNVWLIYDIGMKQQRLQLLLGAGILLFWSGEVPKLAQTLVSSRNVSELLQAGPLAFETVAVAH